MDRARQIQIKRYKNIGILSNSELTPKLIDKYCVLDEKRKTNFRKRIQ